MSPTGFMTGWVPPSNDLQLYQMRTGAPRGETVSPPPPAGNKVGSRPQASPSSRVAMASRAAGPPRCRPGLNTSGSFSSGHGRRKPGTSRAGNGSRRGEQTEVASSGQSSQFPVHPEVQQTAGELWIARECLNARDRWAAQREWQPCSLLHRLSARSAVMEYDKTDKANPQFNIVFKPGQVGAVANGARGVRS